MNKLLMPALGAAFLFGAPHVAAADNAVQLAQQVPGMPGTIPGYTYQNRTVPPGSPSSFPSNRVGAGPAFPSAPYLPPMSTYTPRTPGPGDLNAAEPELVGPGEPDASGRIGPTVDRSRARYTGERGPDGKLLPTYLPNQAAQATPATPQTPPQSEERMRSGQTPPSPQGQQMNRNMPSNQGSPSGMSQPGSGQMNQSGQMGTGQQMDQSGQTGEPMQRGTTTQQRQRSMQHQPSQSGQMSRSGGRAGDATAALNELSAQGYTNISKFERVGSNWQATANKGGRTVTVQVDPQTHQITER